MPESTYKLLRGPQAVDFSDYLGSTLPQFRDLLDSDPSEREIQRFLELNPSFVPGARTAGGGTCGSRLLDLLISQPILPGLDSRCPDFMWLNANSDTWFPVLIEIEKPSKKIFRKDGNPTAEFTHARNQLNQWRSWFEKHTNRSKFQEDYGIPESWLHSKQMSLRLILIYGRREEFKDNPELNRHRATLLPGNDEELMSFDRLAPDPLLDSAITVRANGPGRYRALAVAPTMKLSPSLAERLIVVEHLKSIIDSSAACPPRRREFLKSRLPYWRNWAENERRGWINAADQE